MTSYRVVFLDFDGVVNSSRYMHEWRERGEKGVVGLDPKAIVHVNRICEESGAYVVVSSTWRYNHRVSELKDLLRAAGFTGKVLDVTPKSWEVGNMKLAELYKKHGIAATEKDIRGKLVVAESRGAEIDAWLRTTPREVESFVILDDDSDTNPHKDRHVKTDFAEGLCEKHIEMALAILKKPFMGFAHELSQGRP